MSYVKIAYSYSQLDYVLTVALFTSCIDRFCLDIMYWKMLASRYVLTDALFTHADLSIRKIVIPNIHSSVLIGESHDPYK